MDKITEFLKALSARDYIIAAVCFFLGVLVG